MTRARHPAPSAKGRARRVQTMLLQGRAPLDVALRLRIRPEAVDRYVRRYGRQPAATREYARALEAAGMSRARIAKLLGLSRAAITITLGCKNPNMRRHGPEARP